MTARRGLIGPDERTSIRRQCEPLGVSRSSVYYVPVEPDAEELELMRTFAWPLGEGEGPLEMKAADLMLLLSGVERGARRRRWYDSAS